MFRLNKPSLYKLELFKVNPQAPSMIFQWALAVEMLTELHFASIIAVQDLFGPNHADTNIFVYSLQTQVQLSFLYERIPMLCSLSTYPR